MNIIDYRFKYDKNKDNFLKENYKEIMTFDDISDLEFYQIKEETQTELIESKKERIKQCNEYFGITDFEKEFLIEKKYAFA
jgi:hypothetical protein